jgi:hypothetical protein
MSKNHKATGNTCPVCYDIIEEYGIFFHKTRRQTHRLCLNCGVEYLTPLVKQALNKLRQNIRKDIHLVKCPGICHNEIRNQCTKYVDIRTIISRLKVVPKTQLWKDILKISYVIDSPYRYLCPNKNCDCFINIHPEDTISHTECDICRYNWCRNCGVTPYHEYMSCLEHEVLESKTENAKYIQEKIDKGDMKYCPQCRTPTEKIRDENGKFVACNKMTCKNCDIKWCWLCQESGIDYGHFNEKNSTSCANKLYSQN